MAPRALSPQKQALADQLLAQLRDAYPLPVTTHQLVQSLGTREIRDNRCGHPDICQDPRHWRTYIVPYRSDQVTPLLRRLVKQGLVEETKPQQRVDSRGSHYWLYTGPFDDPAAV